MPARKRRGKVHYSSHSWRNSTRSPAGTNTSSSTTTNSMDMPAAGTAAAIKDQQHDGKRPTKEEEEEEDVVVRTTRLDIARSNKNKEGKNLPLLLPSSTNTNTNTNTKQPKDNEDEESLLLPLVLTSEKRQNTYECDYCHQDISQQPRIRCAVCTDFDLCLDCFATSDHQAMMARIKATLSHTHHHQQQHKPKELAIQKGGSDDYDDNLTNTTGHGNGHGHGNGNNSVVAISSLAAANHDSSHGYRVCDSTRYPVFAAGRVSPKAVSYNTVTVTATTMATSFAVSSVNTTKEMEKEREDNDKLEMKYEEKQPTTAATMTMTMTVDSDDAGDEWAKSTTASSSSDYYCVPSSSNMETMTTPVSAVASSSAATEVALSEDPKLVWTAEEDLRLIDAIKTHGLGNWLDISEAITGNGSVGKTPKRCMERYFDDFLGRNGHILPPWTAVLDDDYNGGKVGPAPEIPTDQYNNNNNDDDDDDDDDDADDHQVKMVDAASDSRLATGTALETPVQGTGDEQDTMVRSSKRQRTSISRMSSGLSSSIASLVGGRSKKKLKVVPTETIPGYHKIWPKPYLPPNTTTNNTTTTTTTTRVKMGQEVARDLSYKAELAFVKATLACPTKAEADKIRKDWQDQRLGQIGSPTVLPPRPEDCIHLPGSELVGYMPRRGDFDVEWANDAEQALADMEFTRADTVEERQLKLQVLDIYCQKLDQREKRKNFILSRHLYDYRQYVANDQKLPQDERDLVSRMRMVERFHTPAEHQQFIKDILKAKQLRKEIAKLQMYRRMGIRSLVEAEQYELDKNRRQFHKMAQLQKRETDAAAAAASLNKGRMGTTSGNKASTRQMDGSVGSGVLSSLELAQRVPTESLWKQYRTNNRKARRYSSNNNTKSGDEPTDDTLTSKDHRPVDEPKSSSVVSDEKMAQKKIQTESEGAKETNSETQSTENANIDDQNKGHEKIMESQNQSDALFHPLQKNEQVSMDNKEPINKSNINKNNRHQGGENNDDFDISECRGIDLLSKKERSLCKSIKIYPVQYLEIKKALIHEALVQGMLDSATSSQGRKTIVKIDVERRGSVIDFMVRAGWISKKLGDVAKRVVTPPPVLETKLLNHSQEPPSQEPQMKID
jgi:hypothetical protein